MTIRFFKHNLILCSDKWTEEEYPFMAPFRYTNVMRVGNAQGGPVPPHPSYEDIIISGNGSLTLASAKENGLKYVKLFGACEQIASGNIGTAYIANTTTEITGDITNVPRTDVSTPAVSLLKSGNVTTDNVPDVDWTKDWELLVVNTKITSSNDIGNAISVCIDRSVAIQIYPYSGLKLCGACYIDGTQTSYSVDTITLNTNYDFRISYEERSGLRAIWIDYKLSSSDTWTPLLQKNITLTQPTVSYIGLSSRWNDKISMPINLSNVTFTNDGIVKYSSSASSTPTPDAPMDIVCNNGAIKYSINEANYIPENVTLGYWLRNKDGQPEASSANFYTNLMPAKPNTSYVCYGRSKDGGVLSNYNRFAWYDANGNWLRNSTYTQGTIGQDVSPSDAAFVRFHCNINGNNTTQELIDRYNWTLCEGTEEVPYQPYVEGGLYVDGTVEMVEVDTTGNTANAERLLGIGDTKDEQSIIDGELIRNIGIKVFDGTEDWTYDSTYGRALIRNIRNFYSNTTRSMQVMCTHFVSKYNSEPISSLKVGDAYNITQNGFAFHISQTSVEEWKQWLISQYQAGSPVIVMYPLRTPTTETAAGQPLDIQAGTNIVEITQASISDLPLEVKYTKVN